MPRRPSGWPEVEAPAPMPPEELEAILFALGSAYGFEYDRIPSHVLAPALGLADGRMIERYRRGQSSVPGAQAKLLRLFHSQSRIW